MGDEVRLPKVDSVARAAELAAFPERARVEAARLALAKLRLGQVSKTTDPIELAFAIATQLSRSSLREAINGSGVVLHTGLGRARLPRSAANAIASIANNHSTVEIDLETGRRGDRQEHVREMLCDLTGASDALVVNNCAAALFLSLVALCDGREVLLSRGEMVEIGGSFRMPDIIASAGCKLVEVGCTNKTRIRDYADAKAEGVRVLLRCHPSNFKQIGFVEKPSSQELAALAGERSWYFVDDIGSGAIVDPTALGIEAAPTLRSALEAGADVVLSSGDKLLGGPQCGLILGSEACIAAIRSHPVARAVRVDKLTLAGLRETLRLYQLGRFDEIPTIRAMTRESGSVRKDAQRLAKSYRGRSVVESGETEIGGGSAPGQSIGTWRVGLDAPNAESLAEILRNGDPAVFGRIERGKVWLDPRTMDEDDVRRCIRRLKEFEP